MNAIKATQATLQCVVLAGGLLVSHMSEAAATASREFAAALRAQPDVNRGATLFRECAACHGAGGMGTEEGNVPRIAGQHASVLIRQLVDYRYERRWDIRMEHFAGRHILGSPQEIADVAAYAAQLIGDGPRNVGDGELAEHGAGLYAHQCAECHGSSGEGNDKDVVPILAGQHYEYLLRQMYDAIEGRRPNFSRSHVRLLARLERDDLVGIADYLSRLDWPDTRQPTSDGREEEAPTRASPGD